MSGSPEDYASGVAAGLIDHEAPGPSADLNAKVKELTRKIRSADGERLRVAEARVAELEEERAFIIAEHDNESHAVCDLQVKVGELQAQLERVTSDGREVFDAAWSACRYLFTRDQKFKTVELSYLNHVLQNHLVQKSQDEQAQLDRADDAWNKVGDTHLMALLERGRLSPPRTDERAAQVASLDTNGLRAACQRTVSWPECLHVCHDVIDRLENTEAQLDRAKEFTKNQTAEIDSLLTQLDVMTSEAGDWRDRATKPRPMSEAPKQGSVRLVYTVVRNAHHQWRKYSEEPDGWLPTTTDEQVGE